MPVCGRSSLQRGVGLTRNVIFTRSKPSIGYNTGRRLFGMVRLARKCYSTTQSPPQRGAIRYTHTGPHTTKHFDPRATLSCYYIHCRYRMNSTFSTEPIAWIEILVGQITQNPRRQGGCIPSCRRPIHTNQEKGYPHILRLSLLFLSVYCRQVHTKRFTVSGI